MMTLKEFCKRNGLSSSEAMRSGIGMDRKFNFVPAGLFIIPDEQVVEFDIRISAILNDRLNIDQIRNGESSDYSGITSSGVYFLFKNTELIYIGSSKNLSMRVKSQYSTLNADDVRVISTPDYKSEESIYTMKLGPLRSDFKNTEKAWIYKIVFDCIDLSHISPDDSVIVSKQYFQSTSDKNAL